MTSILHSCFYLQESNCKRWGGKVRCTISERSHLQEASMISCAFYTVLHWSKLISSTPSTFIPSSEFNPSVLNVPYWPMQMPNQEAENYTCLMATTINRKSFPGGSVSKESTWKRIHLQCRISGFNPWVEKIPWGGNGNTVQYSCLGNAMDREAWWATVHRVTKSQTQLSD